MTGQPPDPRLDRYRPVSRALRITLWSVFGLAVAAVILPAPFSSPLAVSMAVLLVGAPLARVGWLAGRWFRRGDTRFALVGCGVLAVTATGLVLALLGV